MAGSSTGEGLAVMSLERQSDSSLIIGVAASTAERVQLARLLGDADALLLVSSADQARAFLELTGVTIAPSSAVMAPTTAAPTAHPTAPVAKPIRAVPEPVAELRLDVDRRVVRWRDRE